VGDHSAAQVCPMAAGVYYVLDTFDWTEAGDLKAANRGEVLSAVAASPSSHQFTPASLHSPEPATRRPASLKTR